MLPSEILTERCLRSSLNDSAAAFAEKSGAGSISGIVKIRHTLDVRSANVKEHFCHMQLLYTSQCEGRALSNMKPLASLRRLVLAHNNFELRDAVREWCSSNGWDCVMVAKENSDEALGVLRGSEGAPLICESTFPLELLPDGTRAVVWSKTAASTASVREHLFKQGVTYVAEEAVPTSANLFNLFAAVAVAAWPGDVANAQAVSLLDIEGAVPSA